MRTRSGGIAAVAMAALAAVLGASAPASAQTLVREVKIGALAHDVPDLWSGFRRESAGPDLNIEVQFAAGIPILAGYIRPALGASIAFGNGTSHAYLDARYTYETPAGWFFSIGLGGAVHDGHLTLDSADHKALGSRLLFHIPVEIGFAIDAHNVVSAYFEHTSNANTSAHNEGLDRVGIRYGYRF